MVAGLWTGNRYEETWHTKGEKTDFYDIKGVVEALGNALNLPEVSFAVPDHSKYPYYKAGSVAQVSVGNKAVGAVGRIDSAVLKNFELRQDAFCFELNFDVLAGLASRRKQAKPVSRFPSTTRDIALILDEVVEARQIVEHIEAQEHDLVADVQIFDVYKGPPISAGKKSLALRLTYCSLERSLTDEEVNALHEAITASVLKHFGAELPSV
jgi:phenylalanyl-tRNA synthetase beta chain